MELDSNRIRIMKCLFKRVDIMANQSVFFIFELKNKAYQGPNYITQLLCYNIVTELQRSILAHMGRILK